MKKVKIGVVVSSDNDISQQLSSFNENEDIELVGVFFVVKRMRNKTLLKRYSQYSKLLKDCDAIFLSLGEEDSFPLLKEAVLRGKSVLYDEGPLFVRALDFSDLLSILSIAISESSVFIEGCFVRKYSLPYVRLRSEVQKNFSNYGKLLSINIDAALPKLTEEQSRFRLTESRLHHDLDIVRSFADGEGYGITCLDDEYDMYDFVGKFSNGIKFRVGATRGLSFDNYDEVVRLRFEKGEAELRVNQDFIFNDFLNKEHRPIGRNYRKVFYDVSKSEHTQEVITTNKENVYPQIIADFVKGIRDYEYREDRLAGQFAYFLMCCNASS